jgi:hypothetical protein
MGSMKLGTENARSLGKKLGGGDNHQRAMLKKMSPFIFSYGLILWLKPSLSEVFLPNVKV